MNYDSTNAKSPPETYKPVSRGADLLRNSEVGQAVIGLSPEESQADVLRTMAGNVPITQRPVNLSQESGVPMTFGPSPEVTEAVQPQPDMPPAVPGVIDETTRPDDIPRR